MNSQNLSINEIQPLFEAGLHLGHKKNRLHPKARRFVYKIEKGVSIIDLTLTVKQLNKAKEFLTKAATDGKTLLVVATKKVASSFASEISAKNNIARVTTKWLPGLLTNFETIIKNVKKLKELHEQKEQGAWDNLPKHERGHLQKQIFRLEKFYGGIINLEKRPDVLFVLDIKKEKNAILEALKINIPIVAVTDTNADPDEIDYPIVANDDSPTAVEFLISEIIKAYTNGKK